MPRGKRAIDEIGHRYGRLVAIDRAPGLFHGSLLWVCQCDCGQKTLVAGFKLRQGHVKSCGCLKRDMMSAKRGDKSPSWRGGRSINSGHGYVTVPVPDHPDAVNGRMLEHRLIMEQLREAMRLLEQYADEAQAICFGLAV